MAASEQQISNMRDVITGGAILMLLIIVLDVYATELFELLGGYPSLELFEFRLSLFLTASAAVWLGVRFFRSTR